VQGWAALYAGETPIATLEQATDSFRRLGAGVLEAWARALLSLALARAGAPEAREAALQAESMARYAGTPGARYFPYLALAEVETEQSVDYGALARAVEEECKHLLDVATRGYRTTAVLAARDKNGKVYHIVGCSTTNRPPRSIRVGLAGRSGMEEHELEGWHPRIGGETEEGEEKLVSPHAEIKCIQTALLHGLTPVAVGVSRPPCPDCSKVLKEYKIKSFPPAL
jgi:hypothetical protein